MQQNLGHRRPPPRINANAVFGPPRYTVAQQAANPTEPMTRVVKDVISVGVWNVGGPQNPRMQEFTHQTLKTVAQNFSAAQHAGHSANLTMSHGDDGMFVPTDELIAPIDAVSVQGDWLWMSCYVTPKAAEFLKNPAIKVSPGFMWDYFDGSGNQSSVAMVHVAATDRPVVAGQGAFLAMSNYARPTNPLSVRDRANVELMGLGLKPVPSHISESAIPAFMASVRCATSPRRRS